MPEPFADAGCPPVLADRLPPPGADPACVFFRDACPAAAAAPPLAAVEADDLVADGFAGAEPVEADGFDAPAGLAGADGFVAAAGFGATALAVVSLLTAVGLAGAGRTTAGAPVPPPAGAAPGTGAG